MTREVRIDLSMSTPMVYINGRLTDATVNVTYHGPDTLNAMTVHVRHITEHASMLPDDEGMALETELDLSGLTLFVSHALIVFMIGLLAVVAIRMLLS